MTSLETTLAFFGISVLLGFAPGPDNLFVLMQSALRGRTAGFLVVLGLCTGLLVHTAAVALGLASLFAASTLAFTLLKSFGAVYLVFLAWQVFRAPINAPNAQEKPILNGWQLYRRGIIMNITNPKVSIFFLAFLPQFTDPASGNIGLQVLWLGFVFILATLLVFGLIAVFAGMFGDILKRSAWAQKGLNWLAGTVFLGLAARLAMTQR